jgi:hypothetical protein
MSSAEAISELRQECLVDPHDIERTLQLMFPSEDAVIEVRVPIPSGGMRSGFFDSGTALIECASKHSGNVNGVYVTLNKILPREVTNQLDQAGATSDRDVITRENLLIDIDVKREGEVSSTDEEHESALGLAREIASCLTELDGQTRF